MKLPTIKCRDTQPVRGMIICGTDCEGHQPTAMDPLAQYVCPFHSVHTVEDCIEPKYMCKNYEPRPLDEEVYHVVQEEYEEYWGYGEETWADFISEEASFTPSTWNRLVQRQEQIQSEKKTCKES